MDCLKVLLKMMRNDLAAAGIGFEMETVWDGGSSLVPPLQQPARVTTQAVLTEVLVPVRLCFLLGVRTCSFA